MEKIFLIKADFQDVNRGEEKRYFCPDCNTIEGLLSYYPRLRNELEINYVDYARPRPQIVELLGEENQSCPVLVREDGTFINEPNEIIRHLVENYKIGKPH